MLKDIALEQINPSHGPLRAVGVTPDVKTYLTRLWARRDFILTVPFGQLRAQTQDTLLGASWHLLNPLMSAALYYVIFGLLFRGSERIENYPAFLVVGIFTFLFTSRTTTAGANSVTSNIGLVSQINFPRLALPIASTLAEMVSHAAALGALVLIMPALGVFPSLNWLLALPVLILQGCFNLGLAMVAARLAFEFRDVITLLPHLLRFWLYLSGVFFSAEFVAQLAGRQSVIFTIFSVNPARIYIDLMRAAVLGDHAGMATWIGGVVWAVVMVLVGFVYFRARETHYGAA